MSYIKFEDVTKEYRSGQTAVLAADQVCFEIEQGGAVRDTGT